MVVCVAARSRVGRIGVALPTRFSAFGPARSTTASGRNLRWIRRAHGSPRMCQRSLSTPAPRCTATSPGRLPRAMARALRHAGRVLASGEIGSRAHPRDRPAGNRAPQPFHRSIAIARQPPGRQRELHRDEGENIHHLHRPAHALMTEPVPVEAPGACQRLRQVVPRRACWTKFAFKAGTASVRIAIPRRRSRIWVLRRSKLGYKPANQGAKSVKFRRFLMAWLRCNMTTRRSRVQVSEVILWPGLITAPGSLHVRGQDPEPTAATERTADRQKRHPPCSPRISDTCP